MHIKSQNSKFIWLQMTVVQVLWLLIFWRSLLCHQTVTSGLVMDSVKLFPQTVGQDSKVLILLLAVPAKLGEDFTIKAVQDTFFCFGEKKINTISTVMEERRCSLQRGLNGVGSTTGSLITESWDIVFQNLVVRKLLFLFISSWKGSAVQTSGIVGFLSCFAFAFVFLSIRWLLVKVFRHSLLVLQLFSIFNLKLAHLILV